MAITATQKKVKTKINEILSKPYKLILHNDDFNTFEHVISCLVKICSHEEDQASQCANIIHYNGLCDVKYGDKETLTLMKEKLRNCGLSATLEPNC